jgi:hypothetical protein
MFIATHDGSINAAFIKRTERRKGTDRNGKPRQYNVTVDADGHEYVLNDYMCALEHLSEQATTVPAMLPLSLVRICSDEGGARWSNAFRSSPGEPGPADFDVIELPSGKFQQARYEAGCTTRCEEVRRHWTSQRAAEPAAAAP